MTRKTKRQIERDIDDLDDDDDRSEPPLIFTMTHVMGDDTPHPELTVESWPDSDRHDTKSIAVPNRYPPEYLEKPVLLVESCSNRVTDTWDGEPEDDDIRVRACTLWDALSEEDLKEEKRLREENDDPIPPLLEDY